MSIIERAMVAGEGLVMSANPREGLPRTSPLTTAEALDGTAGTLVTAKEFRLPGGLRRTTLSLNSTAITIGDNESLGVGVLIYTFPAGSIIVNRSSINVGVSLTTGTPTSDTPEIGLGTVIASGGVSVLGGTATFEDILGGTAVPAGITPVLADIAGTIELFSSVPSAKIPAASAHTVHLNLADGWANVDNTAATVSGTVVIDWTLME